MPILPSDVDGTNPGDGLVRDTDGKRLRELCEVLLTARAKMLGLSQSMGHRFSPLPENLKSSLVSALGEIVAHLDSFDIKPGDTRLTGKVKLGVDVGMDAHFPEEGLTWSGGSDIPERPGVEVVLSSSDREVRALLTPGREPQVRKRRRGSAAEAEKRREERLARDYGVAEADDEEPLPKGLYGHAVSRHRRGLSKHELTRRQHEMLVWQCLKALSVEQKRPAGSFEQRVETMRELQRMGYLGSDEDAKWTPTVAGFEASGLLGSDGSLEVDP